MCSVDPDENSILIKEEEPISSNCRKCGAENSNIILRGKDVYCNSCFSEYFIHKFRSTIGKSKQIQPGDKILLDWNGGLNAAVLTDLIAKGLTDDSRKKIRFEPSLLYIDESCLYNHTKEKQEQILKTSLTSGLPCYYTSFENCLEAETPKPILLTEEFPTTWNSSTANELQYYLSQCKDESVKDDLLHNLRIKFLCQSANKLGFEKIFLCDSATNVSVNLMSLIASGRGSQVPQHVQFRASLFDMSLYRPLREILQEEIRFYATLNCVTSFEYEEINKKSTIFSCTKSFLENLHSEFPSTIPTVFRTGSKLVGATNDGVGRSNSTSMSSLAPSTISNCTSPVTNDASNRCILCGFSLDVKLFFNEASAYKAKLVSQMLSQGKVAISESGLSNGYHDLGFDSTGKTNMAVNSINGTEYSSNANGVDENGYHNKTSILSVDDLTIGQISHCLCYACKNHMKDMDLTQLPPQVKEDLRAKYNVHLMRKEIEEFILD